MPRSTRRAFLTASAGAALLALSGCSSQARAGSSQPSTEHLPPYERPVADPASLPLPSYVKTAAVRDGYEFALARPDVLRVLPCYCGCGLNAGHRSNLDCFIAGVDAKGSVVFDDHGSYCQTCLDIAGDAKSQVAAGKSLTEIRAYVDARNSGKGPGTNTPPPSAGS